MINLTDEQRAQFYKDSVPKRLVIPFIDNPDINLGIYNWYNSYVGYGYNLSGTGNIKFICFIVNDVWSKI